MSEDATTSLRRRLLLAAAGGIALALGAVGVLLVLLFRQHVEAELAQRAQAQLDALVAGLAVAAAPAGASVAVRSEPPDPAFAQPFSGLYWLVDAGDGTLLRSRSWWDAPPPAALAQRWPESASADSTRIATTGPRGEPLVLWARRIEPAGAASTVVVAVAADAGRLQAMTGRYARTVTLALALLGAALLAAAWLQVRAGLAPMDRLAGALRQLREGAGRRITGRYPAEVQPLVDDLNHLLDDNARLVDEARRQTGDLAHALKTPLAVITNAVAPGAEAARDLLTRQAALMQRHVDLHLLRARALAGAATSLHGRARTPLAPVLDDLRRAATLLHRQRAPQIGIGRVPDGLAVAVESHALHDALGNLIDNACTWARQRVQISVAPDADAGTVRIDIDDDGPGIAPALRDEVLARGRRLDERTPGSGLGLAIVDELARLHGGTLALAESPVGGLRATLTLPAAGRRVSAAHG